MLKNKKFLGVLSMLSFAASLVIAAPVSAQSTVVIQKQNTTFAIDGNIGAVPGQQIYLWNTNQNNSNQQWIEAAQGSGHFSYQKNNTALCLDGGDGGARRQAVTLRNCDSRNQNQHWQKVRLSNGSFRLQKRGTNFSIDGDRGGAQGQSIYLWNSSDANVNQQWQFFSNGGNPGGGNNLDGELITHDFNDGRFGGFTPCTVSAPNYSRVINGRVKTYWAEENYRGNRATRGAEFCEVGRSVNPDLELRTQKHGWMGFTLNINSNHTRNADSSLAQVMGYRDWDTANKFNSWTFLLNLRDGDLGVSHRRGAGGATESTILENIEYGVDHDVIVGFVNSDQSQGMLQIWVNGRLVYSATNINLGMGDFNNQDEQFNGSHSAFKLGMYNHTTEDYVRGEERIVYYDNVSWYTGSDGFSIVDPGNDLVTPVSSDNPVDVYLATGQSNVRDTWVDTIQARLDQLNQTHANNAGTTARETVVVTNRHPGNGMIRWWSDNGAESNFNADLKILQDRFSLLERQGFDPRLQGIFWFQGEKDSASTTEMDKYKERFRSMSTAFARGVNQGPVPVALAVIDLDTGGSGVNQMRSILFELGSELEGFAYDTRGFRRYDGTHLDATSSREVGKGMADEYYRSFIRQ